ncbi:MAG: DUF5615 family PIN-like protein [Thermomonas sp.]
MKAAIDENLPTVLAKVLHPLAELHGHEVVHVTDLVKKGTKDPQVFAAIGKAGISVHITQDHHHRKLVEREVIAGSGLIVFVLAAGWADQSIFEKTSRLIRWWPLMMEHAQRMRPPAVFRVPWQIRGKGQFETIRNVQRAKSKNINRSQ